MIILYITIIAVQIYPYFTPPDTKCVKMHFECDFNAFWVLFRLEIFYRDFGKPIPY